ncbi:hypothetical protein Tfer_3221 [Thermincola ferriacetica]|uniref:DUF4342 domain-containing protein n=2 Tax=Thermincola TaxID=278993 RepID=D5XAP0_THEPJ|nr:MULTISPECIES: DUF4342 domain-containing protein [Thermincola]ADG83244.1 conserved hypothetical protein [Thermincola potens JR]KNZ68245.1 hypothetical protein Tfer_3221 [Thermincola ferriacetica]
MTVDLDLEKIDIIRERLDVSYREAKEALEKTNGDIIEALVLLEEQASENWSDRAQKKGEEVINQIKTYIKKGTDTKIKVKQGDKTLFEVPATLGALGVLGALANTQLALVAGIGTIAAMANKVTLELEKNRKDDENNSDEAKPANNPTNEYMDVRH